jgi:hypothetical protein
VSAGALRRYLRFLALATLVAAVLGAVGAPLTRAAAGNTAVGSMIAALLVCWASAAVGGLPIALTARRGGQGHGRGQGQAMLTAALAAMLLRLAAVVAGAAAVALAGAVPRGAFLAWIGVGYLALLVVETWYAVNEVRRQQQHGAGGGNEGRAVPLEAPPGRTTRMETR